MNHKEILSALLMGDTLKMTSIVSACPEENVPDPFVFFVKLIGDQLHQRYNIDDCEFTPVDNSLMLFAYSASVHESGPAHFKKPEMQKLGDGMTMASAYTDGREIKFFHGEADEVSIDAFHKMKKIESWYLATSRNNPLI